MENSARYVGLDVHKETIAVAVCEESGLAQSLGTIPNTPEAVAQLMRKLSVRGPVQVAYEAGPCGYVLYHQLRQLRIPCLVAAPTLIPVRSGDRVKTDRRDAIKLARFLRSGDLTAVFVPDEHCQALRDLLRCRQDAEQDQKRARNRLTKFLLREGLSPPQPSKPFSLPFQRWLRALSLPIVAKQRVLSDYIAEVEHVDQRVKQLEVSLAELMPTMPQPMQSVVSSLQSLHGVQLLTAATVVAETGELGRFEHAGQLFNRAAGDPTAPQRLFRVDRPAATPPERLFHFDKAVPAPPERFFHFDKAVPTAPERPFHCDKTVSAPPERLFHVDRADPTPPQRLFHVDRPDPTAPQRLFHFDRPAATPPQRLFHFDRPAATDGCLTEPSHYNLRTGKKSKLT